MTLTMTSGASAANDQTNSVHTSFASTTFANVFKSSRTSYATAQSPSLKDMLDDSSSRSVGADNCSIHIADASMDLRPTPPSSPSMVRSISAPSFSWFDSENDNTLDMGMCTRRSPAATGGR